ncbi:MAG: nitroreductase family protein [Gaiellaceae bacterium]
MKLSTSYSPEPLRFTRLSDDVAERRSDEFLHLMAQRRSVRQFSGEPVSRRLVDNALRVAASAPSGANRQPWEFVVVEDPATKARIRVAAEREEELLYGERASQEYLEALEPIGTDSVKPHLTDAPVLIVVFEQPWSRDTNGEKRRNYYVRESVGIAVGFLLAALHQAGVGTLTHAPSPMGFLNEIVGRPPHLRAFLVIAAGYPAADAVVPHLERKPFDEVVDYS